MSKIIPNRNKYFDVAKSIEANVHERPTRSRKRERDFLFEESDSDSDSDAEEPSETSALPKSLPLVQTEPQRNNSLSEEIKSSETSKKEEEKEEEIKENAADSSSSSSATTTGGDGGNADLEEGEIRDDDDNTNQKVDENTTTTTTTKNVASDSTVKTVTEGEPAKKRAKTLLVVSKTLGPDGKTQLLQPPEGPVPTLEEVLDTLASHFIPNPDAPEFKSFEEMLVPMEEAWWYYTDVYCEAYEIKNPTNNSNSNSNSNSESNGESAGLPRLGFRDFVHRMFDTCPSLARLRAVISNFSDIDEIVSGYSKYKQSIPCAGIIILDSTLEQVLLVKGAWRGAKWGFPKGKLKPGEDPLEGALREVREETGAGIKSLIDPVFKVTRTCGGKTITMFLACNVPWSGSYAPKVRNEISCIEWHRVRTISENKTIYANVLPFLSPLERWIDAELKRRDTANDKFFDNNDSTVGGRTFNPRRNNHQTYQHNGTNHQIRQHHHQMPTTDYTQSYTAPPLPPLPPPPPQEQYVQQQPLPPPPPPPPQQQQQQQQFIYDQNTQYQYYGTTQQYPVIEQPIYQQQPQQPPLYQQQQQQYYQNNYDSQPQQPQFYQQNYGVQQQIPEPYFQQGAQYIGGSESCQYYNQQDYQQQQAQQFHTQDTNQYTQSFNQEQQEQPQYSNVPITNIAMAIIVNKRLNENRKYAQDTTQLNASQRRIPSFLL